MNVRTKLTWITVTLLALSAEGSAGAQSAPAAAPAHACSANDPTLACMAQWSAPVGPELAAARASLDATKKNATDGSADLNSIANRQAAAGNKVGGGLGMPSGAGAPMQSTAGGGDSLQVLHSDATGVTSTNAGQVIRIVPVGAAQDARASMSGPAPRAETVVRGQINPAAKSCYENDPDSKSKPAGRLVMLIKLTPAGDIDSVDVSNNVGVNPAVASCIAAAAGAARFAPPGAKGATVRAAFTFPAPEEDLPAPTAGRAVGAQVASASGHAAR
jgi:hypothetical protein